MSRKPNPLESKRKRCLDVIISAVLVHCTFPVTVLVAVLVRVLMGAPALCRELRPVAGMPPFRFWKFRSTVPPVAADTSDSVRLKPFGRVPRKLSLDELPQLWLVLCGKMSLVVPRPLRLDYPEFFTSLWDERLARIVWYVENWSFGLDLRILFQTLPLVGAAA